LLKWKNIAGDYASEQPGGQTIIESFGSHPKCRSKQIHKRDSDYKKGDEVELSGNSRFSNSAEDSPTDSIRRIAQLPATHDHYQVLGNPDQIHVSGEKRRDYMAEGENEQHIRAGS
jgi:hypothetical protein